MKIFSGCKYSVFINMSLLMPKSFTGVQKNLT